MAAAKSKSAKKQEEHEYLPHETITFFEWHAPGRPFKAHSFEFFFNVFIIMMAVQVILFLFNQSLLMLVVLSLVFLVLAMSLVPPHTFHYKITSEGILIEDYFYIWEELYDFFFIKHHGSEVLYLTTKSFYPGELKLTLGEIPVDEIKRVLLVYLPYREYVRPTFTEKSSAWLERNFPLEKKTA